MGGDRVGGDPEAGGGVMERKVRQVSREEAEFVMGRITDAFHEFVDTLSSEQRLPREAVMSGCVFNVFATIALEDSKELAVSFCEAVLKEVRALPEAADMALAVARPAGQA